MGSASTIRWLSSHHKQSHHLIQQISPLSLFIFGITSCRSQISYSQCKRLLFPTSTYCSNCGYKGHSSTQCAVTPEFYSNKTTATAPKVWRVKSKTTSTENPSTQPPQPLLHL